MLDSQNAFLTPTFLRSVWDTEYAAFCGSQAELALLHRLQNWAARKDLKETSAEAAFIEVFFENTWGYRQTDKAGSATGFTLWPNFTVAGAGDGGPGEADLAIGYFGSQSSPIPQVLCEFKSIKSVLDADQKRKGNTRSPVWQCLDYLSHARKGMIGSEPIVPTWGLVTDMNEFRLYWYDSGHRQFLRFVVRPTDLFHGPGLLADTEAARFERFLFLKVFHSNTLLTAGGQSVLVQLIRQHRFRDQQIEDRFYKEYRSFRVHLYTRLLVHNPPTSPRFPGTRGRLVRLAQKILDRLLFVFFCEDMGQALAFPPKLLQDLLVTRADDPYFNPGATTIWQDMLDLFRAMNEGTAFGGRAIHAFNCGLFAPDQALEVLCVPNGLFCQSKQGQSESTIGDHKLTVLYFYTTYNYAADLGASGTKDGRTTLGLYMLGRIFEQSITELEMLEAAADGRPSINKLTKRKTDGVYYTPEWVVERVVDGTLAPTLASIREACGWPGNADDMPTVEAIDAYLERLRTFTVLDPACGSGAFLITSLRYLATEWQRARAIRAQVAGAPQDGDADEATLVRQLLSTNIYGIDINSASVEIAQLALWLHTARGDQPLSSLEETIRCGNSLITDDFYRGVQLEFDDVGRERVNAFNWETAFPDVFARGGFDAIVGNPPYVKLQNLRAVQPDIVTYLIEGRPAIGHRPFRSTRTGNFDLYLPFIERGLTMLNSTGRLGYIAPSLWIVNDYGAGLRELVEQGRYLDRWLDFKSFQVFEEATIYTALQFFAKSGTLGIQTVQAPRGIESPDPWTEAGPALEWENVAFGDRWLLLTGTERKLVDRLTEHQRLGDPACTRNIFVGIQTSADAVYYLQRVGKGRYKSAVAAASKSPPAEVEIEDVLMHPLISGSEAKRYVEAATETFVMFPYAISDGYLRLIPPDTLESMYPKAWSYLLNHKSQLEMREAKVAPDGTIFGRVCDAEWYRYVYPKNLDKQHLPKIIVPRLVAQLCCAVDETGQSYLDNVDVGGILPAQDVDAWFIAGILNASVSNYIFKRISKPFRGGYFSANKQFISSLPIPSGTAQQRADVAACARELQRLHTLRRDQLALIARRLDGLPRMSRPETWLLHGLPDRTSLSAQAPAGIEPRARKRWATQEYAMRLKAHYDAITPRMRPDAALEVKLATGELLFLVDGVTMIDRVFVTAQEEEFIFAQWKLLASTIRISHRTTGKDLVDQLRDLAVPSNAAVTQQVVALVGELSTSEAKIRTTEEQINELVFSMFSLSDAERKMVIGE